MTYLQNRDENVKPSLRVTGSAAMKAVYQLSIAGQTLVIAVEDILFLAQGADVQTQLLGAIGELPFISFGGVRYPVYSLRDGFIPNLGVTETDKLVALLRFSKALDDSEKSRPSIAIACESLQPIMCISNPHALPEFMVGFGPIVGVVEILHEPMLSNADTPYNRELADVSGQAKEQELATAREGACWLPFTTADRLIQYFEGALGNDLSNTESLRLAG